MSLICRRGRGIWSRTLFYGWSPHRRYRPQVPALSPGRSSVASGHGGEDPTPRASLVWSSRQWTHRRSIEKGDGSAGAPTSQSLPLSGGGSKRQATWDTHTPLIAFERHTTYSSSNPHSPIGNHGRRRRPQTAPRSVCLDQSRDADIHRPLFMNLGGIIGVAHLFPTKPHLSL